MEARRRYQVVITDMDGTLYSWVDYIVPALEAMVTSLSATTGLPRIRIVQSLKEVYERHGTNEYAFAIQESRIFQAFSYDFDSFNALVIDPARRAFAERRRRYLRPFPGVVEGLEGLRARGVKVVALSDAPRGPAERRLKQLGLDDRVDALYALEEPPLPDRVPEEVRARDEAGFYRSRVPVVVDLPHACEKPSPKGVARILEDLSVPAESVLMVGDSLKKDMGAARAAGVTPVWAEYGTYVSPEYRERLDVISARSVTQKNVSEPSDADAGEPALALSNFKRILDIVDRGGA